MAAGIDNKHLYLIIVAINAVFLLVALIMFNVLTTPVHLIIFSIVAILISRIIPVKDLEIKKSAQRIILYNLILIAAVVCLAFGYDVKFTSIFICIGLCTIGVITCINKDLDSDDKKWRRWNYGLSLIVFSILLLILSIFIIPDEYIYSALFLMMIIYEVEIVTYEIKID